MLSRQKIFGYAVVSQFLIACGGGGSEPDITAPPVEAPPEVVAPEPPPEDDSDVPLSALDEALQALLETNGLTPVDLTQRQLPSIQDPIAILGKKLFFSKSLSGQFDVACASCHHPMLGGADDLSLPIGIAANNPNLLGEGRTDTDSIPSIPRNSPTVFNVGLFDRALFWDARVESLNPQAGSNGSGGNISTPDSGFGNVDVDAGDNLVAAQARFPITSVDEMKSDEFEQGSSNTQIRAHLAARIGDYAEGVGELDMNLWITEFQAAFDSDADAENLITFDNIAFALGEYQRSMVLVDSPWQSYLAGQLDALSNNQKQGAILFFSSPEDGGASCVSCHSGDLFSDERNHTVGFPQIGNGVNNGPSNDDDFGRENVTRLADDRYRFRTPSLLNVSETAPYGHAGAYETLQDVVRHYNNPRQNALDYAQQSEWCDLDQFEGVAGCQTLYPNAEQNTLNALNKLRTEQQNGTSDLPNVQINGNEVNQLVAFLNALTDPCVLDRACMSPWIADATEDSPDDQVLIGEDAQGNAL